MAPSNSEETHPKNSQIALANNSVVLFIDRMVTNCLYNFRLLLYKLLPAVTIENFYVFIFYSQPINKRADNSPPGVLLFSDQQDTVNEIPSVFSTEFLQNSPFSDKNSY